MTLRNTPHNQAQTYKQKPHKRSNTPIFSSLMLMINWAEALLPRQYPVTLIWLGQCPGWPTERERDSDSSDLWDACVCSGVCWLGGTLQANKFALVNWIQDIFWYIYMAWWLIYVDLISLLGQTMANDLRKESESCQRFCSLGVLQCRHVLDVLPGTKLALTENCVCVLTQLPLSLLDPHANMFLKVFVVILQKVILISTKELSLKLIMCSSVHIAALPQRESYRIGWCQPRGHHNACGHDSLVHSTR